MAQVREQKHANLHEWENMKIYLEDREMDEIPKFTDGDVWWTAVGENIGIEINGKGGQFSRPVIIFKKMSSYGFVGIPLTSQKHGGSWYTSFTFQDQKVCAVLSQIRIFSTKRLYGKIGRLTVSDFRRVQEGFNNLYVKNIFPSFSARETSNSRM